MPNSQYFKWKKKHKNIICLIKTNTFYALKLHSLNISNQLPENILFKSVNLKNQVSSEKEIIIV